MNFAHGKIVLALEGGYNLESIANSMMACIKVLLEDKSITGSLKSYPFESTWHVIQAVNCILMLTSLVSHLVSSFPLEGWMFLLILSLFSFYISTSNLCLIIYF